MAFQPYQRFNSNFSVAKPKCPCGRELMLVMAKYAYPDIDGGDITCNVCSVAISSYTKMYHCPRGQSYQHPNGYDECTKHRHQQIQSNQNLYNSYNKSQRSNVNRFNSSKYKNESTFLPPSPINGPQKHRNLKHMQAKSAHQFSLNDNLSLAPTPKKQSWAKRGYKYGKPIGGGGGAAICATTGVPQFSLNDNRSLAPTPKKQSWAKRGYKHGRPIGDGGGHVLCAMTGVPPEFSKLIGMAFGVLCAAIGWGAQKIYKYFCRKRKLKAKQKAFKQARELFRFSEDDIKNKYIFNKSTVTKRYHQLAKTKHPDKKTGSRSAFLELIEHHDTFQEYLLEIEVEIEVVYVW